MKNLSLLFLALVALPIEAATFSKLAGADTTTKRTRPKATVSVTKETALPAALASSVTSDDASERPTEVISKQPSASNSAPLSVVSLLAGFSIDTAEIDAPLAKPVSDIVIRSHEEWNEGRGDRRQRRFEDTGEISVALRNPSEKHMKRINDRLQAIPYVRPVDETESLKAQLHRAIEALKLCKKTLSHLSEVKTKEVRSEICKAIPEPEPTKNPTLRFNVKTRPLSEIVLLMAKKQIDPYATLTESSRTVVDCGQSIIESSRISDIEHTATNFASNAAEKSALLETKRITEFTTLLAQLEGYARARDLETISQTRLDELEQKASALEAKLLHPASETIRIETERALLTIAREKAGVMGQLEGARKDRVRKNNAIVVARTEAGSYKAWLGALGAKTADYASNPQETPLMIEEVFSKILPHLSKEEKRKKALAFLDVLTGKTRASSPTGLTWTGQQSIKVANHPDFSCIIEGKDLSGKRGTEREILLFGTEGVEPIKLVPALSLLELYRKRAGLIPTEAPYKKNPTLDELHARRDERPHWAARAKGLDDRTLQWERDIRPVAPTAASSESATA